MTTLWWWLYPHSPLCVWQLHYISERVSDIGYNGVHVDVHLLVSNELCQNLCNIEESILICI